jgi:chaperonin cofactor prefoldin
VEKIQKDLQNMMNNKVNIERLQTDMEKVLQDIEKLKDKIRASQNGNTTGE